jgi:hypothetical protein
MSFRGTGHTPINSERLWSGACPCYSAPMAASNTTRQRLLSGPYLVLYLALLKVLLHLVLTGRYGYFRDELYYLACADHLAWGYVDHPPLSIFVLWLVRSSLGDSLFALRLLPVLAGAATMLVAGRIARRMGGGDFAQALAALAVMLAPVMLAFGTFYSMNAFEVLLWTLALDQLVVLLQQGPSSDGRRWLLFGLVIGLAALNKLGTIQLGLAVVLSLALTRARHHLRTRWIYLGGLVALAVLAPHLIWQLLHGWPFLEFVAQARAHKMVAHSPLSFLGAQLLLIGPAGLLLWLPGALYLLLSQDERVRPLRALGVAFALMLALTVALGGKSYYAAGVYPALLAVGAVLIERVRWKPTLTRAAATVALVVTGGAIFPLVVPTLRPKTTVRYLATLGIGHPRDERSAALQQGRLPPFLADRFGWSEMVATVARVYDDLPADEQRHCAILTGNYGEAGAVDFFGPAHGLPRAISPHNSYWLWGPGEASGRCLVVVGVGRKRLSRDCLQLEEKARVRHPHAVAYENDLPVFVCRGLRRPIADIWRDARHYI